MKRICIAIILFCSVVGYSGNLPADKARGIFLAVGVGPRLPVGTFSNQSDLGYGFNLELSYTDNEYLPFFIFAKAGFEQYPGSPQFYQTSDHNNLSTTIFPVVMGARYYFPPIMENVVLFIPIVEASVAYSFLSRVHQFKPSSEKNNYTEELSEVGFNVGVGISMFLVELVLNYNYFKTVQFVGFDVKVRLPLFVNY
jgi:hypothetical protein